MKHIDPSLYPVEALNQLWKELTVKQKTQLLKARGLSTTWAKTKTIKEMVNRGGGIIANSLLDLIKLHAHSNPGTLYQTH